MQSTRCKQPISQNACDRDISAKRPPPKTTARKHANKMCCVDVFTYSLLKLGHPQCDSCINPSSVFQNMGKASHTWTIVMSRIAPKVKPTVVLWSSNSKHRGPRKDRANFGIWSREIELSTHSVHIKTRASAPHPPLRRSSKKRVSRRTRSRRMQRSLKVAGGLGGWMVPVLGKVGWKGTTG